MTADAGSTKINAVSLSEWKETAEKCNDVKRQRTIPIELWIL
jgi:hypothetical protein